VREWWNSGELHFATPRHHLFDLLGLAHDATGPHKVGNGVVVYQHRSPARLSRSRDGADVMREDVKQAMGATGQTWKESRALVLRRGPYIVAAGLEDTTRDATPVVLKGRFILLFDPAQPVISEFLVGAGTRGLLVDLDRFPKDFVGVVAAACEVKNQKVDAESISFDAIGQADTRAVVSLLIPQVPQAVTVDGKALASDALDFASGVLRLRFANHATTVHVQIAR
jgi:hypothetical protein